MLHRQRQLTQAHLYKKSNSRARPLFADEKFSTIKNRCEHVLQDPAGNTFCVLLFLLLHSHGVGGVIPVQVHESTTGFVTSSSSGK